MDDIYKMLLHLEPPVNIRPSQHAFFTTVISTTLWHIWYFYWQFIIEDMPFLTDTAIAKIESQISILHNPTEL
jgi:hypothetical protein